MNTVKFTPLTDIEDYLINDFNTGIYKELTGNTEWKEWFDTLEFLNLMYEQFEIVNANKSKPLSVVNYLLKIDLEKHRLYYLLHYLQRHIESKAGKDKIPSQQDKQLLICHEFIEREFKKIEAELYPKEEKEIEKQEYKFDFNKIKTHLETLPDIKAKIKYLIVIKTEYEQQKGGFEFYTGTTFEKQCDLEISKIQKLAALEQPPVQHNAKPLFKLSNKKGTKTDLIRIFNAIYELRMIEKSDGQIPSKETFMKEVGEFFGIDFSKYDADLSQAMNNTSVEANLKIFEEMKTITQKKVLTDKRK